MGTTRFFSSSNQMMLQNLQKMQDKMIWMFDRLAGMAAHLAGA